MKRKIERKYDETERALIEQFAYSQRKEDMKRMKEIADVLSQFKSYSQCVDAFIEQSQSVSGNFAKFSVCLIVFFSVICWIRTFFRFCCPCVKRITKSSQRFLTIQSR